MVASAETSTVCAEGGEVFDRQKELRTFDDTKTGVKGLVDAGVAKIPPIFHCKQSGLTDPPKSAQSQFSIPIINLEGIGTDSARRAEVVEKVRDASENWGFFQIVNHRIPISLLDEMIDGVRRFHEQDGEVKKEFYTRDQMKKVLYYSNYALFTTPEANWRDTLACYMEPESADQEKLPVVCRDVMKNYSKEMKQLGTTVFELLSEALGLKPSFLEEMQCGENLLILGHYYPPCPEPELTMGTTNHWDFDFLTILLQDQIGGLQVLCQDQWVDVSPVHGALIVNIGDLLQVASNGKFKSINHRVLAKKEGPRISVASFFLAQQSTADTPKQQGPISELISEAHPPVYRNFAMKEYLDYLTNKGFDGISALEPFKI